MSGRRMREWIGGLDIERNRKTGDRKEIERQIKKCNVVITGLNEE